MTKSKVVQASERAHKLDDASQELLTSIQKKDNAFRLIFTTCWTILLVLALLGLWKQNQIANANKQHIDCIVKYFVTPLQPGTAHKVIQDAAGSCKIKLTP